MTYTPERTGQVNHLPLVMGICGAYAFAPYHTGRKFIEERQTDSRMNPILTKHRIQ